MISYFSMANHSPPMITVSVNTKSGSPKDTARNIMQTKEFTVNIISEAFVEAANFTSVEAPEEIDEWIGSGLTREPSVGCYLRVSRRLNIYRPPSNLHEYARVPLVWNAR